MKRAAFFRNFFLSHTSPVIRFLILGDVVFYAAIGILGPIFALFVVGFIEGGSAEVAGIAIAVYLVTKSLAQIPAAYIVDKVCGDRDDFWFMFGGLMAASVAHLLLLFVRTPMELYAVEFLIGLALAFNFPSFYALFTKYIPDNREATSWSIYYTVLDLASAGAAALGGFLATVVGFEAVILAVAGFGFVGGILLLPIRSRLKALNC